jgi:hypothetical protein
MKSSPKTLLAITLFCSALIPASAQNAIPFRELGDPSPLRFAEGKMIMEREEGAWRVKAPNFWSAGWQIRDPFLPSLVGDGEKRLVVLANGLSANDELTLKIRFIGSDWKRADIYEIPLTQLAQGEPAKFRSSTLLGKPVEQIEGGLPAGERPTAVQFMFAGKGNSPIDLLLHSLTTGNTP